jgi:NhaP-type Na+/H+ and K+/H+ antiporter
MGAQDIRQLPVVTRDDGRHPIGLLRRSDIVRAYSQALLDRLEVQAQRPILGSDLEGTRVVEIPVPSGSVLAGRTIADLQLPVDTLVVAVERKAQTLIPRGDTRLQEGDCLQVLVRDQAIAALHEHITGLRRPAAA